MANIVISRIQHRRGRRENLPQPLLPAEVALTSDTGQAWIGQDPALAVPSINVYSDKLEVTAQGIVDNNIVETRFDENMTVTIFNTLVAELKVAGGVTLVDDDILWDDTYRGTIETITVDSVGSNYQDGDVVIAVSATGSAFTGTLNTTGGNIDSVTITNGGINYRSANTTFILPTAAGRTGGALSVAVTDIYGSTVHIAADPTIDVGNTVGNITSTIASLSTTITNRLLGSTAFGGTFSSESLIADNHTEAANVVTLINRVNGTTPGEITGLVFTNLNIEITGGTSAGAVVLPYEAGFYFEGLILAANALKVLHVTTQAVTFVSGVASEAYANIPIVAAGDQVYDLQKNGISFGDVTFSQSTNVGVVTISSSTSFVKGDRLEVFGPASPDGVLDQIAITITGTITV